MYIVCRALAYLAGVYPSTGVPVIIDAATLCGGWRDLAQSGHPAIRRDRGSIPEKQSRRRWRER